LVRVGKEQIGELAQARGLLDARQVLAKPALEARQALDLAAESRAGARAEEPRLLLGEPCVVVRGDALLEAGRLAEARAAAPARVGRSRRGREVGMAGGEGARRRVAAAQGPADGALRIDEEDVRMRAGELCEQAFAARESQRHDALAGSQRRDL